MKEITTANRQFKSVLFYIMIGLFLFQGTALADGGSEAKQSGEASLGRLLDGFLGGGNAGDIVETEAAVQQSENQQSWDQFQQNNQQELERLDNQVADRDISKDKFYAERKRLLNEAIERGQALGQDVSKYEKDLDNTEFGHRIVNDREVVAGGETFLEEIFLQEPKQQAVDKLKAEYARRAGEILARRLDLENQGIDPDDYNLPELTDEMQDYTDKLQEILGTDQIPPEDEYLVLSGTHPGVKTAHDAEAERLKREKEARKERIREAEEKRRQEEEERKRQEESKKDEEADEGADADKKTDQAGDGEDLKDVDDMTEEEIDAELEEFFEGLVNQAEDEARREDIEDKVDQMTDEEREILVRILEDPSLRDVFGADDLDPETIDRFRDGVKDRDSSEVKEELKNDGRRILEEWLGGKSPGDIVRDETDRDDDFFGSFDSLSGGARGAARNRSRGPDAVSVGSSIKPTGMNTPSGPIAPSTPGHHHKWVGGKMVDK